MVRFAQDALQCVNDLDLGVTTSVAWSNNIPDPILGKHGQLLAHIEKRPRLQLRISLDVKLSLYLNEPLQRDPTIFRPLCLMHTTSVYNAVAETKICARYDMRICVFILLYKVGSRLDKLRHACRRVESDTTPYLGDGNSLHGETGYNAKVV